MTFTERLEWIKKFRERFERENELLYRVEPSWHACKKCKDGYCCAHKTYAVEKCSYNPLMIEEWWIMLEYVKTNFNSAQLQQLYQNILSPRPDCIFRFGSRCEIHPARAWSCRIHPFAISYHKDPLLFPVGEFALPSCPSFATIFKIKQDSTVVQQPQPLETHPEGTLVKIKLHKRKPLWVIDISSFIKDYTAFVSTLPRRTASDFDGLLEMARQIGRENDLLPRYISLKFNKQ